MDEPRPKRSSYTPAIGLMIAVIVGVIGWLTAPSVLHWLGVVLPNFAVNALPSLVSRLLVTGILILLALIIFGLIAALLAPKDSHKASESAMERERDALRRRQKAARDQARKGKGRMS